MQDKADDILEGTTRKVFRFVYRQREPVGIHDVQRGLGLSSPSAAHYHIAKLLRAGLLKEDGEGYTVNKVVFENMVRIRGTALPLQVTYATFLVSALAVLVGFVRPPVLSTSYVFAVVVIAVALGFTIYEAYKVTKLPY